MEFSGNAPKPRRNFLEDEEVTDPFTHLKKKIETGVGGTSLRLAFRRFKTTLSSEKGEGVTFKGFKNALTNLGIKLSETHAKEVFDRIDDNQSGVIDYKEFRDAIYPQQNMVRETKDWSLLKGRERVQQVAMYADNANIIRAPATLYRVLRAMFLTKKNQLAGFRKFVKQSGSKDARIHAQEVKLAVRVNGLTVTPGVVERLFNHLDPDGHGQITFTEFAKLFFDEDLSAKKDLNIPCVVRRKRAAKPVSTQKRIHFSLQAPTVQTSQLKQAVAKLHLSKLRRHFANHKTTNYNVAKHNDAVDLRGLHNALAEAGLTEIDVLELKALFYETDSTNHGFVTSKQIARAAGIKIKKKSSKPTKTYPKFPKMVVARCAAQRSANRKSKTRRLPKAFLADPAFQKRDSSGGMHAAFRNEIRRRQILEQNRRRVKEMMI